MRDTSKIDKRLKPKNRKKEKIEQNNKKEFTKLKVFITRCGNYELEDYEQ